MLAEEYLSYLRNQLGDLPQYRVTQETWDQTKRDLPELAEATNAGDEPVWTTLDDALEDLQIRLFQCLIPEELAKINKKVSVGELPTGKINAMVIKVPLTTDNYVILFNQGLHHYIFQMIKLFCAVLSDTIDIGNDCEKFELHFSEADQAIIDHAAHVLAVYLNIGDPRKVQRFWPSQVIKNVEIMASLLMSANFYALAHEYAHIFCGHLDDVTLQKTELGIVDVEEYYTSWQQEFEADNMAWIIMNRPWKGYPRIGRGHAMWFAGPYMLMSVLSVLERTVAVRYKVSEDIGTNTHPPILQRLSRLEKQVFDFKKDMPIGYMSKIFFMSLFKQVKNKYAK